jgi:ligand-binding sensor protein
MKVRFLKSVSGNGFHYRKNAVVDIHSEDIARDFLNARFCEVVAEPAKARAKKAVKKTTKKETR